MNPFETLKTRYRKLKEEVTKETADNYDKLIARIDELQKENRILKSCVKYYANYPFYPQMWHSAKAIQTLKEIKSK